MAFEPPVVVFDACILYPFHLRNIVVQIAVDRLVDARWTDEIHDEWIRSVVANMPAIPIERLQITRRLMNDALPGAMVTGYQRHIQNIRDIFRLSLCRIPRIVMSSRPESRAALPSS